VPLEKQHAPKGAVFWAIAVIGAIAQTATAARHRMNKCLMLSLLDEYGWSLSSPFGERSPYAVQTSLGGVYCCDSVAGATRRHARRRRSAATM
jgi:hypothetical protein